MIIRQGHEKLKELEELMNGSGYWNESFNVGIGDFVDHDVEGLPSVPDGPRPIGNGPTGPELPGEEKDPKAKKEAFPSIDGPGTCADLVAKYKRAILSRQTAWRDLNEKWVAAAPKTGMLLDYLLVWFFLRRTCFCLALLLSIFPAIAMT